MIAVRQRNGAVADLKGSLLGSQRLPTHADRFLEKCKHQPCLADSSLKLIAKPAPESAGRLFHVNPRGSKTSEIDDLARSRDRKRVGKGKRGSVRVDLGGGRVIKKKKKK